MALDKGRLMLFPPLGHVQVRVGDIGLFHRAYNALLHSEAVSDAGIARFRELLVEVQKLGELSDEFSPVDIWEGSF